MAQALSDGTQEISSLWGRKHASHHRKEVITMKMSELFRDLFGKRREDPTPTTTPTPAQPATVKPLTEDELEQVQGGASVGGLPSESVPYQGPDSFQAIQPWRAFKY
jgi:bacteriocin-like protein